MLQFHLKACSKCGGDLALDQGDWCCLQCGTYYYTRLYRRLRMPGILDPDQAPPGCPAPSEKEPEKKGWHFTRFPLGEPVSDRAALARSELEPVAARNTGLTRSWSLTGAGSTRPDDIRL